MKSMGRHQGPARVRIQIREIDVMPKVENQPISNLIETVDDIEMAEILDDEKPVARLRTGSCTPRTVR